MNRKYFVLYSLAISGLLFSSNAIAQTTPEPEEVPEKVEEITTKVEDGVDAKSEEIQEKVEATEVAPVVEVPVPVVEAPKVETPEPVIEEIMPALEWTPSTEVRLRGNYKYLGAKAFDITSRARVGVAAAYEDLKINIQLQDARKFGFAGTSDGGITGIHQGYFQLGDKDLWFRAGRQEIAYGGQRMIGSLNWADMARAFDALRLHANLGDLQVDMFGATLAPHSPVSDGNYLAGLYFKYKVLKGVHVEPYILFRHTGPTEKLLTNKHNIASFGLRSAGKLGAIGYDVEANVQTGDRNGSSHLAYAGAAQLSYAIDASIKPKVGLGFSYASGQSADGGVDEFDNFFPTNHKFYGAADLIGWRNMMQGELSLAAKPTDKIKTKLSVFPTLLADTDGRWSSAGGKTVGAGTSDEAYLGTEIDFNAGWSPRKYFSFSGGYSLFLPGKGAEERLGSADAIHYLYLMAGVNFK